MGRAELVFLDPLVHGEERVYRDSRDRRVLLAPRVKVVCKE